MQQILLAVIASLSWLAAASSADARDLSATFYSCAKMAPANQDAAFRKCFEAEDRYQSDLLAKAFNNNISRNSLDREKAKGVASDYIKNADRECSKRRDNSSLTRTIAGICYLKRLVAFTDWLNAN